MVDIIVNGRRARGLVDTGCTDVLVYEACCSEWTPVKVDMTTASGGTLRCVGMASIDLECQGQRVKLAALVVPARPLGVDVLLGMPGIAALGGMSVKTPGDVTFCAAAAEYVRRDLKVEAADFEASFSAREGHWTVAWKWADERGPDSLTNRVAEYAVPAEAREAYDAELDLWQREGWLTPYDERNDGPPKGLIPLMAVQQPQKRKVRPVLDCKELNGYIDAHTAEADVCTEQLREWRKKGLRLAVVDLRRAFLQLRLRRELWPYQTVLIRGRRYALTRVPLGLNVAPLIMKAVVKAVLAERPEMAQGVSAYADDLLVDEDVVPAEEVMAHFSAFGLDCKPPERAVDGARVLGLRVEERDGELEWCRDGAVPSPPAELTRRAVFAWCGQLTAHLPVANWLRPAAAWLKRRVNVLTVGWDDATSDPGLREEVEFVARQAAVSDPGRGPWRFSGDRLIVWTDASSVASGVVLERPEGGVLEDASWLRPEAKAATHINMAELDAAVRGVNLAIAWGG